MRLVPIRQLLVVPLQPWLEQPPARRRQRVGLGQRMELGAVVPQLWWLGLQLPVGLGLELEQVLEPS